MNIIRIQPTGKSTNILGIAMGVELKRDQILQGVINPNAKLMSRMEK